MPKCNGCGKEREDIVYKAMVAGKICRGCFNKYFANDRGVIVPKTYDRERLHYIISRLKETNRKKLERALEDIHDKHRSIITKVEINNTGGMITFDSLYRNRRAIIQLLIDDVRNSVIYRVVYWDSKGVIREVKKKSVV